MADPGAWTPELTIAGAKITGYLLNLDHRVGRHKAAWFIARGFRADFDPLLAAGDFTPLPDLANAHGFTHASQPA